MFSFRNLHSAMSHPMFTGSQTVEMWTPSLRVPGEDRQYMVQLSRKFGCCFREQNKLFINGVQVHDHEYVHNCWSLLCGAGGEYEWQRDGHTFLLMFNGLSWSRFGDHRLFVDGVDVNTGREFSAYWRGCGWSRFFLGFFFFLIGAAALAYSFTAETETSLIAKLCRFGFIFVSVGVIMMIVGLITLFKFRKPRYDPDLVWPGQTTWPSGYENENLLVDV